MAVAKKRATKKRATKKVPAKRKPAAKTKITQTVKTVTSLTFKSSGRDGTTLVFGPYQAPVDRYGHKMRSSTRSDVTESITYPCGRKYNLFKGELKSLAQAILSLDLKNLSGTETATKGKATVIVSHSTQIRLASGVWGVQKGMSVKSRIRVSDGSNNAYEFTHADLKNLCEALVEAY